MQHKAIQPDSGWWTAESGTGCWIWRRALDTSGYGRLQADRRHVSAHRYFYEQLRGPIPEGLEIDHLCRTRACVNPDHMEPVTDAVNTRRGRRAKLTEATAMQVRLMRWTTTLTYEQIADIVGVAHAQVGRIIRGEIWRVDWPGS